MEIIKNENINTKPSRLVFDARIARNLCKRGFYIKDIKPCRGAVDKSIFIYDNTPEFQMALNEITEEFKVKDEIRRAQKESIEMAE